MMKATPAVNQSQELVRGSLLQKKENPQGDTFLHMFTEALNGVNEIQQNADNLTRQYLTGETTDIAQVLLATEKANLAMQLTVQVRNKIVEAYQEISRMQI